MSLHGEFLPHSGQTVIDFLHLVDRFGSSVKCASTNVTGHWRLARSVSDSPCVPLLCEVNFRSVKCRPPCSPALSLPSIIEPRT